MSDIDAHGQPGVKTAAEEPEKDAQPEIGVPMKEAEQPEKVKRRGRPPHPVPLGQHPVSVPGDLWQWALSQPEGASALVRTLLESERRRRAGTFYDVSLAGGHQSMEVATPQGYVTALEVPNTGVLVFRDDERHHRFSYLADASGWRFDFGEDDIPEVLRGRERPAQIESLRRAEGFPADGENADEGKNADDEQGAWG